MVSWAISGAVQDGRRANPSQQGGKTNPMVKLGNLSDISTEGPHAT